MNIKEAFTYYNTQHTEAAPRRFDREHTLEYMSYHLGELGEVTPHRYNEWTTQMLSVRMVDIHNALKRKVKRDGKAGTAVLKP